MQFLEYHQRIVLVCIFNLISYECLSLLDCHSYVKDKTLVNEDVTVPKQKAFIDSIIRNQSLSLQVCDNDSDDDCGGDDVYNESSNDSNSDSDDDLLPAIEQLNISCDKYLLSHVTDDN